MQEHVQTIRTAALKMSEFPDEESIFKQIPDDVKGRLYPIIVFGTRKTDLDSQDFLHTIYLSDPNITLTIVLKTKDAIADDSDDDPYSEAERIFKKLILQVVTDDPEFKVVSVEFFQSYLSGAAVILARTTLRRPVSTYTLT